jgi:LPS export ABC transporter protein LptC
MKRLAIAAAWGGLVVAAGITTWLLVANRSPTPEAIPAGAASETPDYTVADAVVTRFDPQGTPQYVLDATKIAHLPTSGDSALTGVTLDYYDPAGTTWRLTAQRGRLAASGVDLALAGDVHAQQVARSNPLQFVSPEAEVDLENRTVHTTSRVRLWQTGYQIEGNGLEADLRKGVVKLLSDVTGRYDR